MPIINDNTPTDPTHRGHPLRDLMSQLSRTPGAQLTSDDLQALPIAAWPKVRSAARKITAAHAEGDNREAWEIADRAVEEIAASLPDEYPTYAAARAGDDLDTDDPDAIARSMFGYDDLDDLDAIAREMFDNDN